MCYDQVNGSRDHFPMFKFGYQSKMNNIASASYLKFYFEEWPDPQVYSVRKNNSGRRARRDPGKDPV
jgi:hypothetical protein